MSSSLLAYFLLCRSHNLPGLVGHHFVLPTGLEPQLRRHRTIVLRLALRCPIQPRDNHGTFQPCAVASVASVRLYNPVPDNHSIYFPCCVMHHGSRKPVSLYIVSRGREPRAGAHGEDRTPDSRIKNPLLYQLSYMSMVGLPQAGIWRHSDLALPVYSGPSTKRRGRRRRACLTGPGAGDGNRTRVACLEGRCSTIELHRRMVPGADTAYSRRLLVCSEPSRR